jgi:hypothetical protein
MQYDRTTRQQSERERTLDNELPGRAAGRRGREIDCGDGSDDHDISAAARDRSHGSPHGVNRNRDAASYGEQQQAI